VEPHFGLSSGAFSKPESLSDTQNFRTSLMRIHRRLPHFLLRAFTIFRSHCSALVCGAAFMGFTSLSQGAIIEGDFLGIITETTGPRWQAGTPVAGHWSFDTTTLDSANRASLVSPGNSLTFTAGPSLFTWTASEFGSPNSLIVNPLQLDSPISIEGASANSFLRDADFVFKESASANDQIPPGHRILLSTSLMNDVEGFEPSTAVISYEFGTANIPEPGTTGLLLCFGIAMVAYLGSRKK
jgi:hypothetical protein